MSKSILIIEDNKKHRFFLEHLLTSEGFQVDTAKDSKEVEEKMKDPQKYDLVTIDILVPGFNASRFINKNYQDYDKDGPGPKLLVVSAFSKNDEYVKQWPIGIKKIRKPFDYNELLKEIRNILILEKDSGGKK